MASASPAADRVPPTVGSAGRRERAVLAALLATYALAAVLFVLLPQGLRENAALFGMPMSDLPLWQLALANVGIVVVLYGALALAGSALARTVGLPGVLRRGAGPAALLWRPAWIGALSGLGLIAGDRLAALAPNYDGFPHPAFPSSLLASISAGIGEEIAFRLFLMSLWAAILLGLARLLRRPGGRPALLWVANAVAALAFAAGHLGSAMALAGATTPLALPAIMLVELIVLNAGVGLVAGRAFQRDGLVAAVGVHFWADIVWHVALPLLAGTA